MSETTAKRVGLWTAFALSLLWALGGTVWAFWSPPARAPKPPRAPIVAPPIRPIAPVANAPLAKPASLAKPALLAKPAPNAGSVKVAPMPPAFVPGAFAKPGARPARPTRSFP